MKFSSLPKFRVLLAAAFMCIGIPAALAADAIPDFPTQWTAFLNPGLGVNPSKDELKSIPKTFYGQKAVQVKLVNGRIDFAPLFGKVNDSQHAWLFAEINSPADLSYRMGCGADWWFTVYVNGEQAESTFPQGNELHPPQPSDHIFVVKLKNGKNVIAVKFRGGDASSVIAMGGAKELVNPQLSEEQQKAKAAFEKAGVPIVTENVVPRNLNEKIAKGLAPKGYVVDGHWGKLLKPSPAMAVDQYMRGKTVSGSANIHSATFNGRDLTLTLSGEPALRPEEPLYVIIRSTRGKELTGAYGTLQELGAKITGNNATVTIKDVKRLEYGPKTDATIQVGIAGRNNREEYPAHITLGGKNLPNQPLELKIAKGPAGPTPMLNGKPYFFYCFTTHPYIPDRTLPTGFEGKDSPLNMIAARFGGNAASEEWWYGPDQYDFTGVDWELNGMIHDFPNATIAIYLWCHPGLWYGKTYPERLSADEFGKPSQDYYVSKVSFSNRAMQEDTLKAVNAFVRHCEQYFGSKIAVYNLMGGVSCEWQGWACHGSHFADYSADCLKEFKAYAAKRGVKVDHVPTPEEHRHASYGIFRDLKADQLVMLYNDFYAESIANFVNRIAATVKTASKGSKLVGCYYGYLQEYSNMNNAANRGGHNDVRRLLDSPYVDFFLSPQSYSIRALGAPNADMKPYGAMRLAGKFSIMEDDTRTHKLDQCGYDQALNLQHTLKLLKRNAGMYLAHRMPMNQLGEHGGDEMDDPALVDFVAKTIAAGQYVMEQNDPDPTQIAAVIDTGSINMLSDRTTAVSFPETSSYKYGYSGQLNLTPSISAAPLSGETIGYQRHMLARIGALVDVILLDDVVRTAGKYKVVIFLNAYRNTPELVKAYEALRAKGVAIVTVHGAGFLDEKGVDVDAMSKLVGMTFKQAPNGTLKVKLASGAELGSKLEMNPRFAVADKDAKVMGKYVDGGLAAVAKKGNDYFYGGAQLDAAFIRAIAKEQGVHIYIDADENMYAGAHVISIHARTSGDKKVNLPRKCTVVDVYSGETVAKDADSFTVKMEATESRVFLLK